MEASGSRRSAHDLPAALPPAERAEGRLALWNLRAFKRVAAFSLAGDPALHCLAWARDGRTLLAAGADGCARLLDVASRGEVRTRAEGLGLSAILTHSPKDCACLLDVTSRNDVRSSQTRSGKHGSLHSLRGVILADAHGASSWKRQSDTS